MLKLQSSAVFAVALLALTLMGPGVPSAHAILVSYSFNPGLSDTAGVAGTPTEGNANCCGGVNGNLSVGLATSQTYSGRSVLRFADISTLADKEIVSATLRLNRLSREVDAFTNVFALDAMFDVSAFPIACCSSTAAVQTVYRLADGKAGLGAGTALGALSNALGWVDLDVTSTVLNWQTGNYTTAYGFGLVGNESSPGSTSGRDIFNGILTGTAPELLVLVEMPVPEPTTLTMGLMLAAGLGSTLVRRRVCRA